MLFNTVRIFKIYLNFIFIPNTDIASWQFPLVKYNKKSLASVKKIPLFQIEQKHVSSIKNHTSDAIPCPYSSDYCPIVCVRGCTCIHK